jgi:hypothetical protein
LREWVAVVQLQLRLNTEELDSGVIVAVTVAIGIYLQIYSISVNRLYKQLYLYFNFRKVSCLRKTILYVITMEDN